ncbi:hypothetical protein Tco_0216154 [Tanacetum coccineum]
MVNLEFCDKHNMIAYLKKPSESEGFQDIVDFLNDSHMRYALTKNPTIYVSLIKKFWQTATVRTVDNGEQEITVTVDGKKFTVTEASVRRHLQLADVDGGSPRCQEAMGGSIAQTRSERVPTPPRSAEKMESLKADLKQTKQVYSVVYTKLIIQGEDQPEDQLGIFSASKVLADAAKTNYHTYTRRRRAVNTGSGGISTTEESVSTASASMPVSTTGMQEQERLGHEATVRLQEELDEEERQRMTRVHEAAEERNKYSEVDQAKMLVDLINQRKKYFTEQKAKAKRNKPMTQAQQRNYMIYYIKHMGSHTLQQLKIYSFDELKELFETTMKNVNTFVPMETEDRGRASELAAGSSQATIIDSAEVGSSKRVAEAELDHEGSKRQKTNEASGSVQEQPEEEEKELSQEDLQQNEYGHSKRRKAYQFFEDMLKIFDRDDLVMLWNLVKERFSSTKPTDDKESALWVELKRFFEPNTDGSTQWKLQRYMHDPLK